MLREDGCRLYHDGFKRGYLLLRDGSVLVLGGVLRYSQAEWRKINADLHKRLDDINKELSSLRKEEPPVGASERLVEAINNYNMDNYYYPLNALAEEKKKLLSLLSEHGVINGEDVHKDGV